MSLTTGSVVVNEFMAWFSSNGLLIVVGVLIVEIIFQVRWNPTYFRMGPTLFETSRRILSWPDHLEAVALEDALNNELTGSAEWYKVLLFRELSENTYGFRESFALFLFALPFGLPIIYLPIIRGMITVDHHEHTITLRGHLNVTVLLFLLYAGIVSVWKLTRNVTTGIMWLYLLLVLVSLFLLFYRFQVKRYRNVLDFLMKYTQDQAE